MNKVSLVGRLTKDPAVTYGGASNTAIARITLAVDRRFKREGDADADFISCVAFGKTAEFLAKYFKKGMKLGATGRIQTGSYEKDGHKVYTTDVILEETEFVESKKKDEAPTTTPDGFVPTEDFGEMPPFI